MSSITSGSFNLAIGVGALNKNEFGNNNTVVGYEALYFNLTSNQTATGYQALYSNTTGQSNTANGYKSLYANITVISSHIL